MKTIPAIGRTFVAMLQGDDGVSDPRCRSGQLSWIVSAGAKQYPAYTQIIRVSGYENLIRFSSQFDFSLPRTQWKEPLADCYSYELTIREDELEPNLIQEIIAFAQLAVRDPEAAHRTKIKSFPKGTSNCYRQTAQAAKQSKDG